MSRVAALLRGVRRTPNDNVPTPDWLFAELDREFHFTLDTCATSENAKCRRFFTEADNGLLQPWDGSTCWCNPPFSHIGPWTERACLEAAAGHATSVLLVPVWSDRRWWHVWALKADEIRFIEGRVNFPGYRKNGNPYPICLLIFRARA